MSDFVVPIEEIVPTDIVVEETTTTTINNCVIVHEGSYYIFEPGNEMYGHYFRPRCMSVRTWKNIKLLRFWYGDGDGDGDNDGDGDGVVVVVVVVVVMVVNHDDGCGDGDGQGMWWLWSWSHYLAHNRRQVL